MPRPLSPEMFQSPQPWLRPRSAASNRLLALLSTVLLVGFASTVVPNLLPARLLDPAWQWRLSGSLINNAPVAVVGLGLLHLAAWLNPKDEQLRRRIHSLRRWAAAAALGFLLLVPIQAVAVARGLGNVSLYQSRGLRQVDREFAELRRQIQSAPDLASLQRRMPVSLASSMGPVTLQQPLPRLRSQVLSLVDQAQQRARARFSPPAPSSLWPVMQRSLQVLISAPAYALAFAAMSVNSQANVSLLDRLLFAWSHRLKRKRRKASRPSGKAGSIRQCTGEEA
ncbi:MAG: hypothetical protein VKJ05_07810 [Synechococcaceae cyanobacterium]|nr:hypothetical protein [Synechococcaceae cyanobacterium]